jgi:transposase InsO family protein
MDQRLEFVRLAGAGGVSVAELCRRFGISRDTGHRLLRRFEAEGASGLELRSRRPHTSPRQVSSCMERRVLALRDRHPAWGGRKIARRLADLGVTGIPSASTITEILRRHDRLDPAVCMDHKPFCRFEHPVPNALWQMDFKGHFALDHGRCHALTVLDDHCRYALCLQACANEQDLTVRQQLTRIFRTYGLPERILADNGSPWGSAGSEQRVYTALGVWLLQVGVDLWHGRPRHPQTQGKDERFHRTLDCEVLQHRRFADLRACQTAFDEWRVIYNEERPHQALDMAVPASRYRASARCFPERLEAPVYDTGMHVRRVGPDGTTRFGSGKVKLSQAFAGHAVGFRPTTEDSVWTVFFSRFAIAQVNLRDRKA